jgi:FMN phosphatase YigB (HAD superfamily)
LRSRYGGLLDGLDTAAYSTGGDGLDTAAYSTGGDGLDTAAYSTDSDKAMQAVIFDMGRVLVHWDADATLAGLAKISRAEPAELRQLLDHVRHPLGTGALSHTAFHRLLVDQAGADEDWDVFYTAFCQGLRRDDAALRLARGLAERGVPLGIISNTNTAHVQWLHAHLPELALFRSVIWSSAAGLLKPDRAIYELAIQQMALPAARMMFVDDLEENVVGASAAGLAGFVHRDWDETRQAIEEWLMASGVSRTASPR